MKTVLVTGYTGFVGTNLMPYLLNKGFGVIGLGRKKQNDNGFEQYHYDELPQLNYDAVIHLAGKAHDLKNVSNDSEYYEVNTDFTIRVFDEFMRSGATCFIYLSSVKAAADRVEGVLQECDQPNPQTVYGLSKLKAENYLLQTSLPPGKRLFILRPCMIHGPGNKGNLNLLYKLVKNRIPYPLAAYQNKRSLLTVSNLLFVMEALLNNTAINSGVYQVADDEPLSTTDIIDILANALHIKPLKWPVNKSIIKWLAATGDVLHLPLNSERLKKLTESYIVSNTKIKKALGIDNFPITAKDGLAHTALNL